MANGYGNGSIIQLDKGKDGKKPKSKCRKWRLVVSLGRDPRNVPQAKPRAKGEEGAPPKKPKPRYLQKAMNFEGTYTEAQRELRRFKNKVEGGTVVPRSTWTYSDYVDHYIDTRVAAGELQERSASSMRGHLNQLGYRIGALKLQEITPAVVEQAYIDLRNGESSSGRKLCGTTIANINKVAYGLFEDARRKGIIGQNPLDGVPVPRKDTKEKRALTESAYRDLIRTLDPIDHRQCAVLLCAILGLRRSEAVGMSWGDVDFGSGTVNLHASSKDDGELKDPKTESGYRLLPLPAQLAEKLMARKRWQVEDLLSWSPESVRKVKDQAPGSVTVGGASYDLPPDMPVTANEAGERLKPHTLNVWWARVRSKYGLDGWTLHELRHTFLSLAAANGVHPAVMQKLAGHKSATTTMEIYTHVNMEAKRAAMATMESVIR